MTRVACNSSVCGALQHVKSCIIGGLRHGCLHTCVERSVSCTCFVLRVVTRIAQYCCITGRVLRAVCCTAFLCARRIARWFFAAREWLRQICKVCLSHLRCINKDEACRWRTHVLASVCLHGPCGPFDSLFMCMCMNASLCMCACVSRLWGSALLSCPFGQAWVSTYM